MGYNGILSATVSNALLYLRPITGILIGLLTKKLKPNALLPMGFFPYGSL